MCVLLYSIDDHLCLHYHLNHYEPVSNAKISIHKTEAFFLDGRSYPEWIAFLSTQIISQWHDRSSSGLLWYLGFPLIQSLYQLHYVEQQLLQIVKLQCAICSQHRLSIKVLL